MRALAGVLIATAACTPKPKVTVPAPPATATDTITIAPEPLEPATAAAAVVTPAEILASDSPRTTVSGNTFIAPAGWSLEVRGSATILTPPEGGTSHIALADVAAKNPDQAVTLAWAAYNPERRYPLKVSTPGADGDGWKQTQVYEYIVSPGEKRYVNAYARFGNGGWLVTIYDMANDVGEKRGSQVGTIFRELAPKGYVRESFKGKQAHRLDAERLAALTSFVEDSMKQLGVPGVALGIVQNGKVVFAGGFGVRELGKPAKVNADTKFMVASNTKAMTTLMLAKLAQEKKLTWESTATSLLPQFKLGDADTTSKVLVKHLICACTGLPRQDMEFIFEYGAMTPDSALASLGTMQPTSKFGELFQYSNPLAAAAGFIGAHVAYPKLELGKAYDEAMRTRVFAPLGMTSTTFDFKKAKTGNVAVPHAADIDGKPAFALGDLNQMVIPVRPAGGAWSTVRDMLRLVQMELAEGKLPGGKQYIAKDLLLARRAPQVSTGPDSTYGMGLNVQTRHGVTVVHHGGATVGFFSDMMWLPEHNVGAVILTNGDPGWAIQTELRRKLLEVLFDGVPEADASIAATAKQWTDGLTAQRKQMTVPAAVEAATKLAAKYSNPALGTIAVGKSGAATVFDFGEWKSEMASQVNPDGTTSFLTIATGIAGIELVAGEAGGKRTLTLRDSQHEYVFVES